MSLPPSNSCHGSGSLASPPAPSPASKPATPMASSSFTPRSFPPPSLSNVPVEYIIDQLRNLASHYWSKPETADCTIVVPVPHPRRAANRPSSLFPPAPPPSYLSQLHDPSGMGRRVTEPSVSQNTVPRVVLKSHLDYLTAQSTLLRGVFSGASPLDLVTSTNTNSILRDSSGTNAGRFIVPSNRLPRLLPSSSEHPILYLPVPDPTSIHLIFHWLYFGKTDLIREGLDNRTIQWEGIARNVEYLGLPTEIKVFLGKYYRSWLHPERGRFDEYLEDEENEDDNLFEDDDDNVSEAGSDDTAYESCLSDLEEEDGKKGFDELNFNDPGDAATSASATASVVDDDVGCADDLDDDDRWSRGRSRATRCLSASYVPDDDPPLVFSDNRRWSA